MVRRPCAARGHCVDAGFPLRYRHACHKEPAALLIALQKKSGVCSSPAAAVRGEGCLSFSPFPCVALSRSVSDAASQVLVCR